MRCLSRAWFTAVTWRGWANDGGIIPTGVDKLNCREPFRRISPAWPAGARQVFGGDSAIEDPTAGEAYVALGVARRN